MLVPKWGIFIHTHPLTKLGECPRRGCRKDVELETGECCGKCCPLNLTSLYLHKLTEAVSICKDLNKVKPPEVPESMGKDGGRALKASLFSRELLTADRLGKGE